MIYLDSAAIVKLVHAESESQALRDWLAERSDTGWVSSILAEVESFRALARHAPDAITRLPPVLDLVDLVDPNAEIRGLARAVTPATVRSLDAIHLATALRVRSKPVSFVTYDNRLADAARTAGLTVDAPGQ
jgi:predicted nucleic acid-binding protein